MTHDQLGCHTPTVLGERCRLAGLTFLILASSFGTDRAQGASPLRVERNEESVTILCGEQPLLKYRYSNVPYKPYADWFCSPAGHNVLLDAPPDHAHHHALMFAVAVDGVDFWAEFPDQSPGIQRQRELQVRPGSPAEEPAWATLRQLLDWETKDGSTLVTEERVVTLFDPTSLSASLLTWQSTLTPAKNRASVTLSGSHYFGLGMRFVKSMDRIGTFFSPQDTPGELVRGEERMVRAAWCAYRAPVAEGPVTVAVFDHPENLRHPAAHFTMSAPFAYLSATLNLWKEPLKVSAEEPLRLRYGVAIWDGEVQSPQVERLYRRWVQLTGTEGE